MGAWLFITTSKSIPRRAAAYAAFPSRSLFLGIGNLSISVSQLLGAALIELGTSWVAREVEPTGRKGL